MRKIKVGLFNTYYNLPWIKMSKSNSLDFELELIFFNKPIEFFLAVEFAKIDMGVAPFEFSIERMASFVEITILKTFFLTDPMSAFFAKESDVDLTEKGLVFAGISGTDFEFSCEAIRQGISLSATEYMQFEKLSVGLNEMDNGSVDVYFISGQTYQCLLPYKDLKLVATASSKLPTAVVVTRAERVTEELEFFRSVLETLDQQISVWTKSKTVRNDIVKHAGYSIDEVEISQAMNWPTGFELPLKGISEVTKLLSDSELAPLCDIYQPIEFCQQL